MDNTKATYRGRELDTWVGPYKVFVSSGISGDAVWMTVRQMKPGASRHRVKSPRMPLRETPEQAQQDLDTYARVRGWRQA